jgi:regulation of enolase protein 1 (concanavalin A-like superfamily)
MKKVFSPVVLRTLAAVLMTVATVTTAAAQTLPAPWRAADIGSPTLSGSTTSSSSGFTIDAAGADIWGTSDQFHFLYQQVSGDVEVIARVDSVTAAHVWSKAGVMIRASLNGNSAHGYALASAAKGVHFHRRSQTGATTAHTSGSSSARPPVWVRAVRTGSQVTTYRSSNGTSWTRIGSSSIPLGSSAYVGVAVTSHNANSRTTARVSNVRVTRLGLPAGQQSTDIGGPAIAGGTAFSNGTYTVQAAGSDIWSGADEFHFVYQPMTGNGEVIARLASLANTDSWAKAGVMIRESLTAQSRHAMMAISAGNGYAFQRRTDAGAYSDHTAGGSGAAPGWVRLVRTGDLFEAYRSTNGTSWTRVGSDTIAMGATVYVGLAATSHNTGAATTAVFDNFGVTGGQTGGNQPPTVSITAPTTGAAYSAAATVTITASASDPEGRMASVDFYAGTTLIARDTTSPYSVSWSATTAGSFPLTAVANDAEGNTTTSGTVTVTVTAQSSNRPPTVSLTSPANGATFTAPATIALAATASDPDSNLARVEFMSGTTRLATDTTAPYSFSWTGVAAGTYTITAVAYDSAGASATSAAATVTVSGAVLTPPRYVVFTASTDHATNVTSYQMRVFASGANPATATPIATSDLLKPTPASNGDITVDRGSFFTGLAAGNYVATVMAIGPGGQTQSASVTFTR